MAGTPSLTIRRAQRHEITLPVRVRVDPADREAVRVAGAGAVDARWIEGDLVDIGAGGVGIVTGLFLPRMTRARVEIPFHGGDGSTARHEFPARVQRVVMTDRRPAYLLGLNFEGEAPDDGARRALAGLLARLDADEPGEDAGA